MIGLQSLAATSSAAPRLEVPVTASLCYNPGVTELMEPTTEAGAAAELRDLVAELRDTVAAARLLLAFEQRRERVWLAESNPDEAAGLGAAIGTALERYWPDADDELERNLPREFERPRMQPDVWDRAVASGVTDARATIFLRSARAADSPIEAQLQTAFLSYAAHADEGATADPW